MYNKRCFLIFITIILIISIFVVWFNSFDQKTEEESGEYKTFNLNAVHQGEKLNFHELKNITENTIFFTDDKWKHVNGDIFEQDGEIKIEIPNNTTLNILWPVTGFGKVVLRLRLDDVEENKTFELTQEISKQKHKQLANEIKENEYISNKTHHLHELAEEELENEQYEKALNYSLWGLESITLDRARKNIDENRKTEKTITVLDENGQKLEGINITYKMIDNDLNLGWFDDIKNETILEKIKSIGFNTYNKFIFWHDIRPEKDVWEMQKVIEDLKYYDKKDFNIKLSGIISDTPKYTENIGNDEITHYVEEHIIKTIDNITNHIEVSSWECYGLGMHYMADQTLHHTTDRPKEVNINTTIKCIETIKDNTNSSVTVTGWNIDSSEIRNKTYSEEPYSYYIRLNHLDHEISFDFMYFGGAHEIYPDLKGNVYREEAIGDDNWIPARHLYSISEMLDWYSELGKPINIQYFQAPSNYVDQQKGYWRTKWNEEVQADWIEKYYKIIYSKPYIKSINYLELKDRDWKKLKTGIFSMDGSPKESYYRLKKLNNAWTTEGYQTTNQNGVVSFEGHQGEYLYTLEGENFKKHQKISDNNNITIQLEE